MPDTEPKPQLKMLRPTLENLPELVIPEGYTVRSYREGDADAWSSIIGESFGKTPEEFPFDKIMKSDKSFLPERVWFICQNERPVATTSAYYWPHEMPETGMVHYVGVVGGHKGKKLGYWITLAALHQMKREGRVASWLGTDDFRLPAIKTYLNLGFEPLLVDENQRQRWRDVFTALGTPELAEKFAAILAGPVWTKPSPTGGES